MNTASLLLLPLVFGVVGAFTPCALGINAVFLVVLALLAETVLVGDYLFGAVALFIFGVAMSLPLLVVGAFEGANRWRKRLTPKPFIELW